jgi:hypothetical protein
MLTGGGLILLGAIFGRYLPGHRKGPGPAGPTCGCSHHHSFHDPKTGECHARKDLGYWNGEQHYTSCTCRQYSGPQPLPEYYAPEIGDA